MSGDIKRLKVLLPELLPAPTEPPAVSARDRVSARARLFLERFRGLGTTAGAAVLSLHCGGYGVVDPLPPPAQQCSAAPDPFASIQAQARILTVRGSGVAQLELDLFSAYSPAYKGFRVDTARVSGGTLVRIDDVSGSGIRNGGSEFLIVVAPESGTTTVDVEVDIGCGSATRTKRYRLTFSPSAPVNASVTVDTLDSTTT